MNTTQPNIALIFADDLGYGDVACLNPDGKTPAPNMDRIGREGMICTDAHASSAVCTPSRYGILTGRYNWRSEKHPDIGASLTAALETLVHNGRSTPGPRQRNNGKINKDTIRL